MWFISYTKFLVDYLRIWCSTNWIKRPVLDWTASSMDSNALLLICKSLNPINLISFSRFPLSTTFWSPSTVSDILFLYAVHVASISMSNGSQLNQITFRNACIKNFVQAQQTQYIKSIIYIWVSNCIKYCIDSRTIAQWHFQLI